jgi:predicted RNA-binding protein
MICLTVRITAYIVELSLENIIKGGIMAYYLDIFSPETYEAFSKSDKSITGFRASQEQIAKRIKPGDKFICYLTKLSRWTGVLEVTSKCFKDSSPRFYEEEDPFVIRFHVKAIVWLRKEKAVPIKEESIWDFLSFTKGLAKTGSQWTGKFRASLSKLEDQDARFIENILLSQEHSGKVYPIDENEYRKLLTKRVRGTAKVVSVTVPEEAEKEKTEPENELLVRQSIKIQALLAKIGEKMGFKVWIPKADRSRVLNEWNPEEKTLIEVLPLNYDEVTNKTIEQIDVLWLHKRFIVRAFEVEHTTSIYSGILRMADLLALQPNMEIKLHIVAPSERREKVFDEIQRPVFSLLERRPLSEACTFISYDSLFELAKEKHLSSMRDNVLEDYEETVD